MTPDVRAAAPRGDAAAVTELGPPSRTAIDSDGSAADTAAALDLARDLIAHGIPVVVCRPNPQWPDDDDNDVIPPRGWSTVTAAECDLSGYRPGVDALALVGGHGLDVVDVDPKNGGSVDNLPAFRSYGVHATPSGGAHYLVASTGIAKMTLTTSAGHVGDYLGGTEDGGSRGLAFLPGSTRPKYPGRSYRIVERIDLDLALAEPPDDDLIAALLGARGRRTGSPGRPAAKLAGVDAFLAERSEPVACRYGRKAVDGLLDEAKAAVPGDPVHGRHAWAVRAVTRLVELARAGCASAEDFERVRRRLREIKPEGHDDFDGIIAWALTNADGGSNCPEHSPVVAPDLRNPPQPCSLAQGHEIFRRWLGGGYDLGALDVVLAAAAVERLDGDPVWLLLVSGSGNAKTETVVPLGAAGEHVKIISTLTGEAALLSATPRKEAKGGTGGLLRELTPGGLLVIKDFTSILSMNREARGQVLGALREVCDGRWTRQAGADGGRKLHWEGRVGLIGATTDAYDKAHAVIATMGDRFALVRVDSRNGRENNRRRAMANVGHETTMRAELGQAVGGVLASIGVPGPVPAEVAERLGELADVVTTARTAVECDSKGEPEWAHDPESPARFAKVLVQLYRGALAIGVPAEQAERLAARVARDTLPPLRLDVLRTLREKEAPLSATEVRGATSRRASWQTISRTLTELYLLELADQGARATTANIPGTGATNTYRLGAGVDVQTLDRLLAIPIPAPETSEGEHYQ